MRKYIHKYLDEKYFIFTSPVGNYGIYPLADREDYYLYPEYGDNVIKEIVTIFSIEKKEAKFEINIWATGNSPTSEVDLDFYWEHNATAMHLGDLILPIVNRISTRTIASDLISVKPMSTPKTNLMFLDYVYDLKKPWYKRIWDEIKDSFKKNYEIIDPEPKKKE